MVTVGVALPCLRRTVVVCHRLFASIATSCTMSAARSLVCTGLTRLQTEPVGDRGSMALIVTTNCLAGPMHHRARVECIERTHAACPNLRYE